MFSGRYFDDGRGVRVFMEMVSIERGTVEKREIVVDKSMIPASVSLLPRNYNDALYVVDQLAEVQNADNEDFVVRAWCVRGNGGVYRDGEQMVVHFFANRDCFIKLYHIDVNGIMSLIFPNQFYPGNRLEGRRVYNIPDSSYPFVFNLGEPYGVEFIKVIASTVQFPKIEESFAEIGRASRELVVRGLNVKARKEQITEAMFSYTILEYVQGGAQ